MPRSSAKILLLTSILILSAFLLYFFLSPDNRFFGKSNSSGTRVLLIGIDGGSWDILKRLANEGKVPNFQNIIQNGSAGNLNSLLWKRMILGGRGYFSPIVWASIATGKIPSKHGIEDFTLPLPSQLIANLVPQSSAAFASIQLSAEIRGSMELIFRARTVSPVQKRKISISVNSISLKDVELSQQWGVFKISLPDVLKENNVLTFAYPAHQSEIGKPLAEFNYIRLYDRSGQEIEDLHFIREKKSYQTGWQIPQPAMATSAASFHLRTRTLWEILSGEGRKVGVVGWWASWPATKVNGYLISSYVGHQGARMKGLGKGWLRKVKDLVYPPEYLTEVQAKLFLPDTLHPDIVKKFYDPGNCDCVSKKQYEVFRNFYWQDRFFEKLSIDLQKEKGPFDLFAVYFRGIDTSGHQFLDFAETPQSLDQCKSCDGSRLASLVDNYYVYMDEAVGRLLEFADERTVTMVVTDHGQVAQGEKGGHANNGFILMQGGPIRKHLMKGADILDVTPTILYLMGLPVSQDMDGSVMVEAIDPGYLSKHPVSFINTYDDNSIITGVKEEIVNEQVDKEEMEELKALGYVQ